MGFSLLEVKSCAKWSQNCRRDAGGTFWFRPLPVRKDDMPKQKTHKGLAKRVKVSARGKIIRRRSCAGHLMSGKSGNRCRYLRKTTGMSSAMNRKTLIALGA